MSPSSSGDRLDNGTELLPPSVLGAPDQDDGLGETPCVRHLVGCLGSGFHLRPVGLSLGRSR